jgi:membrane associated rhomboid family serine protease
MPYSKYQKRQSFNYSFPPGVKWLIIANVAIYILQVVGGRALSEHIALLALVPDTVVHNLTLWQLVTYLFLHGSPFHILFNMLGLWFFGAPIEGDWGTQRFLKFYFLAGIAGGLCDVAVHAIMGNWASHTIGASGAICGVLVAFGILYPNQIILFFGIFPLKAKYVVMICGAVEVLEALGPNNGISNAAHLGGMAFGLFYLRSRLPRLRVIDQGRRAWLDWKRQRARRKFEVYMRKHDGPPRGPWTN